MDGMLYTVNGGIQLEMCLSHAPSACRKVGVRRP